MRTVKSTMEIIENSCPRSAWKKGVKIYALELLEELQEAINGGYVYEEDLCNSTLIEKALLNGADNWNMFSWGGCSLIYNGDIAERLCCPSELKRTNYGAWRPNRNEEWLDTQARALYQAKRLIVRTMLHE